MTYLKSKRETVGPLIFNTKRSAGYTRRDELA